MPLLGNDLGRQPLDGVVILKITVPALGVGQLMHKVLEHHGAGIAERIHRMSHAVDQALLVEGLPVHDLAQILPHGILVGGIRHMGADIVHHVHDLDVGAAVLGPLQTGKCRRNNRVGVRPRGSHHTGGEGGVVAAAVLHVQQQGNIQHVGLQIGVLPVGTQHLEQVLGGGKLGPRPVNVHAAVALIVMVGMVSVDRQHGENTDQLDALLQLGLQIALADIVVIAGQGQHTAGQGIHQILAGRLHDDIPHKVGGQVPAFGQTILEGFQLGFVGQIPQQQQIGRLLEGIALAPQSPDQVIDVVAAIPQLAVAGYLLAVALLEGINAGNVGDARQHPLAVLVAQTPLDVILGKQRRVHPVVGDALLGKDARLFFNGCVIAHWKTLLFRHF